MDYFFFLGGVGYDALASGLYNKSFYRCKGCETLETVSFRECLIDCQILAPEI